VRIIVQHILVLVTLFYDYYQINNNKYKQEIGSFTIHSEKGHNRFFSSYVYERDYRYLVGNSIPTARIICDTKFEKLKSPQLKMKF